MTQVTIHSAGPGLTVQDPGRPGWKAQGLSTGGAADGLALLEAAALLGTPATQAVIEMMGFGGVLSVREGVRFALTGALMQAAIDGVPVTQNCTHFLPAGTKLTVAGAKQGVFGYLAFGGGINTERVMNSRATHLTARIGRPLAAGDVVPLGPDADRVRAPVKLSPDNRFSGGTIRVMPGPQTDFFSDEVRATFTRTRFTRSARGNRQGIRLDYDGDGFPISGGRNIVSDLIVPGDIQMTGDGVPYVLLAECQTIGGYPRIGSVIPADLPKIAQAAPGTPLQFQFLSVADADATATSDAAILARLAKLCQPAIRDPHDIADLLRYQLISGVTPGDDLERP